MEKQKPGRIESFLNNLFKDFGNLAVAVSTMGRFKPTIEEEVENQPDEDDTVVKEVPPRKVLHPSQILKRRGEFFVPPGHHSDF